VEERAKKERCERMLRLAREAARRFEEQLLGRDVTVLWERESGERVWSGLSDNYVRVFARSGGELANRLAEARLVGRHQERLWGELEREERKRQGE
jgi:threonylcarbamoyladenosine tRNA methylthiotransferase MtaB